MESNVHQTLGEIKATSKAAHQRLDKIESEIREDLKHLNQKLEELTAYMNKGKGISAVVFLMSGLFGAGIVKLFEIFLIKPH